MLNDVSTYEDDFGNTKMLTTVDHSPKKNFSFNITTKEEIENFVSEKKIFLESRKSAIRNIDQVTLQSLLTVYDHMIFYDTDDQKFIWDNTKLEDLMNDGMCLEYLEGCITQSKDKNVNNKG